MLQAVAMWVQILVAGISGGAFSLTVLDGMPFKEQAISAFFVGYTVNWLAMKMWVLLRFGRVAARSMSL